MCLDKYQQLVPVGVPGELYLGGAGLARGYLNRPELTAEKFIANPIPGTCCPRLYRSGDRVRWRTDGNLEYLGRLDQQVKIRGFRIELGEIESQLRQHSALQEVVVVAREDAPGDKRLVAYFVAKDEEEAPTASDLRSYLQQALPEFMLPAAYVQLSVLPLTANGKVDRQALPLPENIAGPMADRYVAPQTPMELAIAKIWSEILGLERVGRHDNFFELGGHSLRAARLAERISQALHKPVPLATIFRAPTIAEQALQFEAEDRTAYDLLEPVRPSGDGATILLFGDFLIRHLPPCIPVDHPVYWCRLEDLDGRRPRYSTVESLAEHYCRQISAAGLNGPFVMCGFSYSGLVAFETARRLREHHRASTLLFLVEPSLADPSNAGYGSRVIHHLHKLPSIARGQRRSHLYAKARALTQLVKGQAIRFYCATRLALRLPIPLKMRWPYTQHLYRQAIQRYVPQPFPVKLVLIHGKEYSADTVAQWSKYALDGIDVHDTQSASHIILVDDKESVRQWTELFKDQLQRLSALEDSDCYFGALNHPPRSKEANKNRHRCGPAVKP